MGGRFLIYKDFGGDVEIIFSDMTRLDRPLLFRHL